jgi:hypothetical protein
MKPLACFYHFNWPTTYRGNACSRAGVAAVSGLAPAMRAELWTGSAEKRCY